MQGGTVIPETFRAGASDAGGGGAVVLKILLAKFGQSAALLLKPVFF
jgi:hypothetical protein